MAADAEAAGDAVEEGDEVAPERRVAAGRTRKALRASRSAADERGGHAVLRRGLERLRPVAALRGDLPGRRGAGRRRQLGRLLHHRAGQAHRPPLRQRRGGHRSSPRARARCSRSGTRSSSRPGKFVVLPGGHRPRHLRAAAAGALRLLSFFPTPEIISTFQQAIYPVGGNDAQLEAAASPSSPSSTRTTCRRTSRSTSPSSGWASESDEPRELTHDRSA